MQAKFLVRPCLPITIAGLLVGCATVSSRYVGEGVDLASGRPPTVVAPPPTVTQPDANKDPSGLPYCDTVAPNVTCAQRAAAPKNVQAAPKPGGPGAPGTALLGRDGREDDEGKRPVPAGPGGLTYFLPRQLARVTASRTEDKLDDAVKAVSKAQSESEAAAAKVDATNAEIRQTEDAIINTAATAPGQAILTARLAAQKTDLATATAAVATKKTALDTAKSALQASATGARTTGPGAYKVALKIELLAPSADPAQAFVLRTHHNPVRDDDQKLVVSSAGLLSSTDVTATDRTADILVEIATFAGAIASGGTSAILGRDGREGAPARDCDKSPGDYTGIVDFTKADSVQALNNDLQCLGVRTVVSGRYWPDSTRPMARSTAAEIQGVVYRTPLEVVVRIEKCVDKAGACKPEDTTWFPTEVIALALPQAGPITYVRQDAGFMTKSKYTLAFKDGILTNYDSSRPSEVLEVARTPMRILTGIFDGASKVISLRTGQNTALTGLSTSQLNLLNAQYALKKGDTDGQRSLSEAQLALVQAQQALVTAPVNGEKSLADAQLALSRAQIALQAAPVEGQTTLSAADLALLQQQTQLQSVKITGLTELSADQLALLQAQAGLATGTNTLTAQSSASQLALTIALLKDRARQDALSRCVSEQVGNGQPIDICLAGY